jgi:hypothetical protein
MTKVNWKNLEKGLLKYEFIMNQYKKLKNVSSSDEFQKLYLNFYGMNRAGMSSACKKEYFKLLDKAALNKEIEFKYILQRLYAESGKKHFSFTTKLLATANSNLPVWDKKVREYLNFQYSLKFKASFKDIESCEQEYKRYCEWFKDFLKKDEAAKLIAVFDKKIPNAKITKMKKIDLMFWQMEY